LTNHLKSLPPSLVFPNLKNSKPKVLKKLRQRFQRLNWKKTEVSNLKNDSTIPPVSDEYKCL